MSGKVLTSQILLFYMDKCTNCKDAEMAILSLLGEDSHSVLVKIDILDKRNHSQLKRLKDISGSETILVPTIIVGEQFWVGFNEAVREELETTLAPSQQSAVYQDFPADIVESKVMSIIHNGRSPAALLTVVIAFIDGFNPCSLWTLTILLAFSLNFRSRKRSLLVGLTFLFITAL